MWVRKVLIILLLALFIFSIFGTVSARLFPSNTPLTPPPRTNDEDPWAGTQNTGGNSGTTSSGIKSINTQINSCSLIIIGNIPVVVFKGKPSGSEKPNAF